MNQKFNLDENELKKVRHDFRTPLNHIIGYSEMLIEELKEKQQENFLPDLEKIHSAGKNLLQLINNFFGLSPYTEEKSKISIQENKSKLPEIKNKNIVNENKINIKQAKENTILVVDDNEMNRDMLSKRLKREGYNTITAKDGKKALELINKNNFDLILLDIMMPEINGIDVLKNIKSNPLFRHIPVIMISALDEIDVVVQCIEIGADDYLPKPVNPVLLQARIGACLEKKFFHDEEIFYLKQIESAQQHADALLHVILPDTIVKELKSTSNVQPKYYENVAVLFCDIVGFTAYCSENKPEVVVANLQKMVVCFEELVLKYNLQKIKTIGDCFMATGGLLKPLDNPVLNSVRCGFEMIKIVHSLPPKWNVRIGIHIGPVIAGVIGQKQYLFDVWGNTVNTAARIESYGKEGMVNVSTEAWNEISNYCHGKSLGLIEIKGKGELEILCVHNSK